MQIGLDSYSFHLAFGRHPDFQPQRPITLFTFIDRIADLGFHGFQIDPQHLESHEPEYLTRIREHAESRNVFVEAGMMGCAAADIRAGIELCRHLHTSVLRTFIGFERFHPGIDIDHELDQVVHNVRSVVADLEKHHVVLAIENHGDVTSEELVRVVERIESPFVGICLDVGNTLCVLEDSLNAVERMAPFAVSTHFKDYAVNMTNYGCRIEGVALGKGVLDLPAMYHILQEKSRITRLVLEIPVAAGADEGETLKREEQAVQESLEYCHQVLQIG
jgi:sugar phosphate isomerase/epimerase